MVPKVIILTGDGNTILIILIDITQRLDMKACGLMLRVIGIASMWLNSLLQFLI